MKPNLCIICTLFYILASTNAVQGDRPNQPSVGRAIPLLLVNDQRTAIEASPEGLQFLSTLPPPLAIVAVAGRFKSGKSTFMNHVFDVNFISADSGAPGTLGVFLWSQTQTIEIDDQNVTVVLMDTEGLGHPTNPPQYDPKLLLFPLFLSSNLLYITMRDVDSTNINNLHAATVLHDVFTKNNMDFPFPKMMWVVQNSRLCVHSADFDGLWNECMEKEFSQNTLRPMIEPPPSDQVGLAQVKQFNKVIQLLHEFPAMNPRVVMLRRPIADPNDELVRASKFSALLPKYQQQALLLKSTVLSQLHIKTFGGDPVSGAELAKIIKEVVLPFINDVDRMPDEVLRRVAEQLAIRCHSLYETQVQHRAPLPCDVQVLESEHANADQSARDKFVSECIADQQHHINLEALDVLKSKVDTTHKHRRAQNKPLARVQCNALLNDLLNKHVESKGICATKCDAVAFHSAFGTFRAEFFKQCPLEAHDKERLWKDWYEVTGKITEEKYQLRCSTRCIRSVLLFLFGATLLSWLLSYFIRRLSVLTVPLLLLSIAVAGCPLDIWEVFGLRSGVCLELVWDFLRVVNVLTHLKTQVHSLWATWNTFSRPWVLSAFTQMHQVREYVTHGIVYVTELLKDMQFR